MFTNLFRTAFRNITKHKSFAIINIAGLSLGLTVCIVIGLFIWDEHQYDQIFKNGKNIFRVCDQYSNQDGTQQLAVGSPMLAPTLQMDFPEVEKTARILMLPETKSLFENGNKKSYESSGYFVDSGFFNIFPLPFKYGSPVNSLNGTSSIVISDEMATRYFDNENPVGKQLLFNKQPYIITGVFVKQPKFHLQFDYLLPIPATGIPPERMQSWGWHQFYTYIVLKNGSDVHALESKFRQDFIKKSAPSRHDMNSKDIPFFQPLKNIHLYSSNFKFDAALRGNITYVNALTIIAIFVLLIACFNFINLATAKSLQRAKEVGVRKSLGADRQQLILQFLGESMVFSFLSLVFAIGCSALLLPWLNQFTGKTIAFSILFQPFTLGGLIALTILVGLLAGFYPALVLSGFKPVKVLKATAIAAISVRGNLVRFGLIIIQFTLSVLLIICAIVVYRQTNYLHNKDLGFNKDQIMFFPVRGDNMLRNRDAFKNELLASPGISSVSIGYGFPGDAVAGDEIIVPKGGQRVKQSATQILVDFDYLKTLGLQLVAGRDFSKNMVTDKDHAFIINETAVKQLGFGTAQNALGKDLEWEPWGAKADSFKTGKVIGVVKDYNYKSLYDHMETTVIQIFPDAAYKVAVKISTADMNLAVQHVKETWSHFNTEYPIEYKFLDENFSRMYSSEDKLKSLLWIFTCIAIFVGCLGLFGLSAYTAEKRKKEVGIRKVLGASISGVVLLLSKGFIRLVMISFLIASPVAWYFMNKWLENFAFRISIQWWVFALSGLLAIVIAFITISFQTYRAAVANPVTSLRSE